jgi:hypothetical protein
VTQYSSALAIDRQPAEYWIARSSRAMTMVIAAK